MKKSGLAGSPFFSDAPPKKSQPPAPPPEKEADGKEKQREEQPVDQSAGQSTNRPIDQSTDQSIDQSTDQSASQSTDQTSKAATDVDSLGPIVARPRAFYITQKVDSWLDEAVGYLKEKGLHKVDRSVLINALLHDPDLFIPEALDALRARLLAHLTNKAIKRIESTE